VVTDKDGHMKTVDAKPAVTQADVDRTRRELRDMLAGNTQFHTDPLAAPGVEVTELDVSTWDSTKCRCGDPNTLTPCAYCISGEY
jgi:hypothetical protein